MGFFSKSKQETTTNTNVVNEQDYSSQLTQDSFNTISSVTNTDNSQVSNTSNLNLSDAFKTVVSQPIAFTAGGGSGGFDLDKFFSAPTDALSPSSPSGSPPMKMAIVLAVVAVAVVLLLKKFR